VEKKKKESKKKDRPELGSRTGLSAITRTVQIAATKGFEKKGVKDPDGKEVAQKGRPVLCPQRRTR